MRSQVSDDEEPDHGIVDSSDDEDDLEEEEEPATQKGQDSDDVRANCVSQEPAVPTAMGDEDRFARGHSPSDRCQTSLAEERLIFQETPICGSPDSLQRKSTANSNGFRRERDHCADSIGGVSC